MSKTLQKEVNQLNPNVGTLYEELKFGNFNYGQKRENFDILMHEFVKMVKKDSSLFEIGCGCGYWIDTYVRWGVQKEQITAVDIAPSNVENAKNKGYKSICSNVLALSIEDNVSDFTLCNGVIQITNDPFKAFSELVRITKQAVIFI